MPYADYPYYRDAYCGTMPEADFKRLSRRASAELDGLTMNRIESGTDEKTMGKVRDACCAVADALLLNEQGGGIASETNDGVSVNYIAGVSNTRTDAGRVYEAAARYLGMTGLVYRGC